MSGPEPLRATRGRRHDFSVDLFYSDPFRADLNRIHGSKAYARLPSKTQVISLPENPHVRTRFRHSVEVGDVAASIADRLGLNVTLCEAIAAGHDIGHTPFGHLGEEVLSRLAEKPFEHHVFSVILAQHIERDGEGLNLTFETLAGIYYHRNKTASDNRYLFGSPIPEEYKVLRLADPIDYTITDLTDAVGYGTLVAEPPSASVLGRDKRERLKTIVDAVIEESCEKGTISFSEGPIFEHYMELRHFMKEEVYAKTPQKGYAYWLELLYEYFAERASDVIPPAVAVALMTDEEAEKLSLSLMHGRQPSLKGSPFGVAEIIDNLRSRGKQDLDYSNPDLDWGKERTPMLFGKN